MINRKPKTAEEYVRLVDQAIIDIEELRSSFDYDIEDAGAAHGFLNPLLESVRQLRQSMADGSYHFENKDLPFMVLVTRFRSKIPFAELLAMINKTHREGLDTDGQ